MFWFSELSTYVGRVRQFTRVDWLIYVGWVGLMFGLVFATGGFLLAGHSKGVAFPAEAWLVPVGALLFSLSIAVDTIGVLPDVAAPMEGFVHQAVDERQNGQDHGRSPQPTRVIEGGRE